MVKNLISRSKAWGCEGSGAKPVQVEQPGAEELLRQQKLLLV